MTRQQLARFLGIPPLGPVIRPPAPLMPEVGSEQFEDEVQAARERSRALDLQPPSAAIGAPKWVNLLGQSLGGQQVQAADEDLNLEPPVPPTPPPPPGGGEIGDILSAFFGTPQEQPRGQPAMQQHFEKMAELDAQGEGNRRRLERRRFLAILKLYPADQTLSLPDLIRARQLWPKMKIDFSHTVGQLQELGEE